jgi:hypothetical protein
MKTYKDGTMGIQAAEDGGFVGTFDTVEGRYTTYLGHDGAQTIFQPAQDLSLSNNSAMAELKAVRGTQDVASKQKAIHDAIRATGMPFAVGWQQLQSTRPELFQGLEPQIIHPD